MTETQTDFRLALSRFASGVCVVTATDPGGRAYGVTISSFCSLSLDPPLVLFCIGKKTSGLEACAGGAAFAVNVLSEQQLHLSDVFARKEHDKFADVAFTIGGNGCRILEGCLATLECSRVETYEGGDHLIVVGRVDQMAYADGGLPLLRFTGRYRRIGGEL
ncbi:Flavin reductase [Candidatus Defluviicoccus seviourii]|uniref:Flavin reductase n=1 Tax=Candidatus Defluviicoccus seviourii TaxID=2565273 RepID=A0A564WIN5_9PROT|nr:Flavin reductase [Candidatus Defluviicoccus seviourii]